MFPQERSSFVLTVSTETVEQNIKVLNAEQQSPVAKRLNQSIL